MTDNQPHNTNWLKPAVIDIPEEMKQLYGPNHGVRIPLHHQLAPPPKPPVAGMYLVGRNKSSFPGHRFHLGDVVLDQKPLGESYTRDEVLAQVQPELTGLLKGAFPRYVSLVGMVQKIPYQNIPESTRSR